MIENGNVNSNHLSSRGLHLNGKSVLQLAKDLLEGIRKLSYEKELLRQKKSIIEIMQSQFPKSRNNFWHNNFYQPNVNGMVFFNTDYRKQRESVTNQISNKVKKKKKKIQIRI